MLSVSSIVEISKPALGGKGVLKGGVWEVHWMMRQVHSVLKSKQPPNLYWLLVNTTTRSRRIAQVSGWAYAGVGNV